MVEFRQRGAWRRFAAAVEARLTEGAKLYGDEGFEASIDKLEVDIHEEIQDAVAYLFMLDERVKALARRARGGK